MAHKPTSESAEIGEAIAGETPEAGHRDEVASKLVDRFALWSGVAGLIPVPIVDAVAVGGLQIQMLRRLSQIYDVAFSDNRGKAVIASLAGSMIPTTSGIGAASMLKAVPILGTIASGFVMPVLSAGATYAIGKAFIQHFASGGTLLDFNPPDYREFIRTHREMWDSRSKGASRSARSSQSGNDATGAAASSS
ncbi:MAG TPA: YcjF family protein [Pseudolabrys sp.]|nr:YcjF family protein [Pseudolabrys sp.]